jgi:hypothetical protein
MNEPDLAIENANDRIAWAEPDGLLLERDRFFYQPSEELTVGERVHCVDRVGIGRKRRLMLRYGLGVSALRPQLALLAAHRGAPRRRLRRAKSGQVRTDDLCRVGGPVLSGDLECGAVPDDIRIDDRIPSGHVKNLNQDSQYRGSEIREKSLEHRVRLCWRLLLHPVTDVRQNGGAAKIAASYPRVRKNISSRNECANGITRAGGRLRYSCN